MPRALSKGSQNQAGISHSYGSFRFVGTRKQHLSDNHRILFFRILQAGPNSEPRVVTMRCCEPGVIWGAGFLADRGLCHGAAAQVCPLCFQNSVAPVIRWTRSSTFSSKLAF